MANLAECPHCGTGKKFSNREVQVLCGLGNGKTVKEIAQDLGISRKTVETYRTSMIKKLGLKSAYHLCYHAIRWVYSHETNSCQINLNEQPQICKSQPKDFYKVASQHGENP